MWIHVQYGDLGLSRFVTEACARTRSLVVEPQEWASYRSARQRLRRLGKPPLPAFDDARPDVSIASRDIEGTIHALAVVAGCADRHVHGTTKWKRRVWSYAVRRDDGSGVAVARPADTAVGGAEATAMHRGAVE
jgi:hypothetical protein